MADDYVFVGKHSKEIGGQHEVKDKYEFGMGSLEINWNGVYNVDEWISSPSMDILLWFYRFKVLG